MNYFFVIILNCSMAALSFAERVSFPDLTDQTTHQLFNELNQFESTPQNVSSIQVAVNAMSSLLDTVSLRIKNLSKYTGVFSGNCSVFFDKTLDFAACDLAASDSPLVTSALLLKESKRLPEAYWQQISLSNILLATVVGDWRRGVLERYQTDLFFKQGSCTGSETSTLSQIATQTASLSLPKTLTGSVSSSDSNSASRSLTETNSETLTLSRTPTQTASLSWPKTQTGILSPSDSSTASRSLTETTMVTRLPSQSQSLSQTSSLTSTDTASKTQSLSAPFTQSSSHTQGLSQSTSVGETSSLMISLGSEWANWAAITGVYADPTNQGSRYTTLSGVVTDSYTGLQWQAAGSSSTYTWSATVAAGSAQAYCASQTTGGFNWRLPTRVELQTLVDYTTSSPAINVAAFPGTQSNYYWTSTVYAPSPSSAWYVNFNGGGVLYSSVSFAYYARCVR